MVRVIYFEEFDFSFEEGEGSVGNIGFQINDINYVENFSQTLIPFQEKDPYHYPSNNSTDTFPTPSLGFSLFKYQRVIRILVKSEWYRVHQCLFLRLYFTSTSTTAVMFLPSSLLCCGFLFMQKTANMKIKLTTPTGTAIPTIKPNLLFFPHLLGGILVTLDTKSE